MDSLIGGVINLFQNRAPVPYGGGRFQGFRTLLNQSSMMRQMEAYGTVGTVFAIVNRIANSTSQVDWNLFRESPSGNREDRPRVTRHLAWDIFGKKPNPFYTPQELRECVQQHIELTGEGYLVVVKHSMARSLPLELWPVRPDRMEPVPHKTDFLAGWIYHASPEEKIPLDVDQVIQFKMPNPLDPYRGLGPIQTVLFDIDSSKYSAEWNRNFFINGAEPGGIIEVEKRLDDDEFEEMRERWSEQHQGVNNAHRVAIIEQGKWRDRKFSMRDMQFTELRNIHREIIREAFGMPKGMLGTVEDINRANADVGEVMFSRWLLVPRLKRWKGKLNSQFLPMFGATGAAKEFDYENPVPIDQEGEDNSRLAKAKAFDVLVRAGVDPAEAAMISGLPPVTMVGPPQAIGGFGGGNGED